MWEHHLSDVVDCDIRKGGEGPDEPDWNASMEKILNDLGVGREGANGPLCFSRWEKFADYPQINDIVKSKERLKLQRTSLKFGDGETDTLATRRAVHRTVDSIRPYGHSAYTGDGTPVTVPYD